MNDIRFLLMVRVGEVPTGIEAEWGSWFDTKHIASRLDCPGFLSARRFVAIDGEPRGECKYMILYDLDTIDALTSESFSKVRESERSLPSDSFEAKTLKLPNFSRGVYEQIYPERGEYRIPKTNVIFIIGHDVPLNRDEEFNAWYNTEHAPAMCQVPGFITARRFKRVESQLPPTSPTHSMPSSPKYLTIYDLESEKVYKSELFLKQANSPWSSWVRSWCTRRFLFLGRRVYPRS
jgi:hypothetical protein